MSRDETGQTHGDDRATKKPHLRFPGVRAPKPLLSREAERQLSARQLELLDALEAKLTSEGLGDRTMAEIAASVGCSLRTLYAIAPSKDELLLAITDRRLHRIGRAAIEALDPELPPLDALRTYLRIANEAVRPQALALTSDVARVAGASRVIDSHEVYLTAVTQSLLVRAVEAGEIGPVDTAAVAHVLGGLGREFARADVVDLVRGTPNEVADSVTELIIAGLLASRPAP